MSPRGPLELARLDLGRLVAEAAAKANEAFRAADTEELAVLLGVNEDNAHRLVRLLEQEPEA